jgi:hypothetical protein
VYLNQAPDTFNVPGIQTPITIEPAQTQLTNMLVLLGIGAAIVLILRETK